jgi:hypothetical protein
MCMFFHVAHSNPRVKRKRSGCTVFRHDGTQEERRTCEGRARCDGAEGILLGSAESLSLLRKEVAKYADLVRRCETKATD